MVANHSQAMTDGCIQLTDINRHLISLQEMIREVFSNSF